MAKLTEELTHQVCGCCGRDLPINAYTIFSRDGIKYTKTVCKECACARERKKYAEQKKTIEKRAEEYKEGFDLNEEVDMKELNIGNDQIIGIENYIEGKLRSIKINSVQHLSEGTVAEIMRKIDLVVEIAMGSAVEFMDANGQKGIRYLRKKLRRY